MMHRRRTLLTCLPASAAMAPLAARAFRLEAPSAEALADYGAACPASTDHEALRAALEKLLEGQPLPETLPAELARLARCPFCGCAVANAADHGEDQSRPEG